ncbi:MAG: TlpA family protein disulfide reductase [Rubrivivax sp.]|nr:TlpA family protein disulfide reductase [Rubrivivax sp.]
MNRRQILFGGVGLAALAGGLAWRQASEPRATGVAAGPGPDAAAEAFWTMNFTQPDDQVLAVASLRGQPLVVNFWGTWCPPCIKEMPELDRFARQAAGRGVRVLGLAVDSPTAVRQYLARSPVSYTIGLAGMDGTDLARQLGNTIGAMPFTAVFDRRGAVVQRKLGTTTAEELEGWTKAL